MPVEAALTANMLYIQNDDKPGFIGRLGTLLGEQGQNISDFRLGRVAGGDHAVALVSLDGAVSDSTLKQINDIELVKKAVRLSF